MSKEGVVAMAGPGTPMVKCAQVLSDYFPCSCSGYNVNMQSCTVALLCSKL